MSVSIQDFNNGIDLSAAVNVSGAQLNSLVNAGTPFSDKGLIMWTTDTVDLVPQVPNATVTTKWQTYLWGRITPVWDPNFNIIGGTVTLYYWNPNAAVNPTFLQWQSVAIGSIASGTITGQMIANLTITDANIASVNISKVIGLPANPTTLIAPLGSAKAILAINSAGNAVAFTPNIFASSVVANSLGAPGQILQMNSNGLDFSWQGNAVLQRGVYGNVNVNPVITTVLAVGTQPTISNSTLYSGMNPYPGFVGGSGVMTFTPKLNSSWIEVDVTGIVTSSGSQAMVALFAGTNILGYAYITATNPAPFVLRSGFTTGSNAPINFQLYCANTTAGSLSLNPFVSGVGGTYSPTLVTVTERIPQT